MNADFVRERISQLRVRKDVSEYKMSYDLGHSRGYIHNISSGKTLPSMAEFLAICDYFGIHPADFFDEGKHNPIVLEHAIEVLNQLKDEDVALLLPYMKRLLKA